MALYQGYLHPVAVCNDNCLGYFADVDQKETGKGNKSVAKSVTSGSKPASQAKRTTMAAARSPKPTGKSPPARKVSPKHTEQDQESAENQPTQTEQNKSPGMPYRSTSKARSVGKPTARRGKADVEDENMTKSDEVVSRDEQESLKQEDEEQSVDVTLENTSRAEEDEFESTPEDEVDFVDDNYEKVEREDSDDEVIKSNDEPAAEENHDSEVEEELNENKDSFKESDYKAGCEGDIDSTYNRRVSDHRRDDRRPDYRDNRSYNYRRGEGRRPIERRSRSLGDNNRYFKRRFVPRGKYPPYNGDAHDDAGKEKFPNWHKERMPFHRKPFHHSDHPRDGAMWDRPPRPWMKDSKPWLKNNKPWMREPKPWMRESKPWNVKPWEQRMPMPGSYRRMRYPSGERQSYHDRGQQDVRPRKEYSPQGAREPSRDDYIPRETAPQKRSRDPSRPRRYEAPRNSRRRQ